MITSSLASLRFPRRARFGALVLVALGALACEDLGPGPGSDRAAIAQARAKANHVVPSQVPGIVVVIGDRAPTLPIARGVAPATDAASDAH